MGLKRLFKRYTPERHHIEKHGRLHLFGDCLHDPNLWHITRKSAPGAVANGLFWAFIPMPAQTVLAVAVAIFFRVNIPISVLFVWLTNPLTMYPIFYGAYKVGSAIMGEPPQQLDYDMSLQWLTSTMGEIWQPLILGCLILGTLSSTLGYYFIRWLWRFTAIRKWEERQEKIRQRKKSN